MSAPDLQLWLGAPDRSTGGGREAGACPALKPCRTEAVIRPAALGAQLGFRTELLAAESMLHKIVPT